MNLDKLDYDELLSAVNRRYRELSDRGDDQAVKLLMKEFKLSKLEIFEFLGWSDSWDAVD